MDPLWLLAYLLNVQFLNDEPGYPQLADLTALYSGPPQRQLAYRKFADGESTDRDTTESKGTDGGGADSDCPLPPYSWWCPCLRCEGLAGLFGDRGLIIGHDELDRQPAPHP